MTRGTMPVTASVAALPATIDARTTDAGRRRRRRTKDSLARRREAECPAVAARSCVPTSDVGPNHPCTLPRAGYPRLIQVQPSPVHAEARMFLNAAKDDPLWPIGLEP
jgi:hypothetical protein